MMLPNKGRKRARATPAATIANRSAFRGALEDFIEKVRESWGNIGLSLAVVEGEDLLYAAGCGSRYVGHPGKVGPDTLFQVGSTTKAITAAGLGILVDEGKVCWDEAIADSVLEFRLRDPWLTRQVTIRDALCHRTGIDDRSFLPALAIMSDDEVVRQLRYASAAFAFRDSYRYSNSLYGVLGKVTEAASGMSWQKWVRHALLDRLSMSRTATTPYDVWEPRFVAPTFLGTAQIPKCGIDDSRVDDVAMPHTWDARGSATVLSWQSYDNAAPAGSIVSSAMDMAKWLSLNLCVGRHQGRQILRQGTIQELHATQNPSVDVAQYPFRDGTEGYAMGWRRSEYHGSPHLAHGGGIVGFSAYAALLPQERLGVVVLSNGSAAAREDLGSWKLGPSKAIAFWVFDRLLSLPARDWNHDLLARAQAARQDRDQREAKLSLSRPSDTRLLRALEEYAGVYHREVGYQGRVKVVVKDAELFLYFAGDGAYGAVLRHWHGDLFRVHSRAGVADLVGVQFASFAIDGYGRVDALAVFGETFQRAVESIPDGTGDLDDRC